MTDIPAGSPHYRAAVENRFAGDARFTEATLAVAYESRTRNLIAVFEQLGDGNYSSYLGDIIEGEELARQIAARLDLA